MTCSGGSAAAPASLPRREHRKGREEEAVFLPCPVQRYELLSKNSARTARYGSAAHGKSPPRQGRVTRIGRKLIMVHSFCPAVALFPPAPLRCLPRPRPWQTAKVVLRRPERPPLFCHLRQAGTAGEAARGEFWGRNSGHPFPAAGVPLRGTSRPFRGTVSRCAEQVACSGESMVRSVEERMRSAEQGVRSAEASRVLRNGSPVSRNGSLVSGADGSRSPEPFAGPATTWAVRHGRGSGRQRRGTGGNWATAGQKIRTWSEFASDSCHSRLTGPRLYVRG